MRIIEISVGYDGRKTEGWAKVQVESDDPVLAFKEASAWLKGQVDNANHSGPVPDFTRPDPKITPLLNSCENMPLPREGDPCPPYKVEPMEDTSATPRTDIITDKQISFARVIARKAPAEFKAFTDKYGYKSFYEIEKSKFKELTDNPSVKSKLGDKK